MRIEKLEIKGFGKLNNVSMTFDKGLNIIFGSNESGKSTVQWFIKAMFFGLKGGKISKDGTPPPLKRFKPWNEGDYTGFMEYRLDNGQLYRIGRNFSTNSVRLFDSLFNDVTNNFDASKEKGIHFAEKHLGLNEVCFEKTAFIRQMEAKIGEDGGKELYNRMMNLSETGFEDISFKNAQEALREALKNYVGTDKTSTRPLDKVVDRLSELRAKRDELISRRDSAFAVENELNSSTTLKTNLQERKMYLEDVKHLLDLQSRIEKITEIMTQATELFYSISSDEEELRIIQGRAEDFNRTKEEFSSFSIFDNEDIDGLDRNHQKLLRNEKENIKLKAEIEKKEKELDVKRQLVRPILAFGDLGEGIENRVIEINKDIEYLKKDYEKSNLEVLKEKISGLEKKIKNYKFGSILATILAALFIGMGFLGINLGYMAAPAALILVLVSLHIKIRAGQELSGLLDEKRMSFININSITEEMDRKQKELKAIYDKVGATGIEEFLKYRAEYDAESKLIAALNSDISRLESEMESNKREISILKDDIISVLIEAGIIDNGANGFDEEHVKKFKYGVRRYKGVEPSINYTAQRLEDITRSLEKHYKNAEVLCGGKFKSKDCLNEKISIMEQELEQLKKELKSGINHIRGSLDEGSYARMFREIGCSSENTEFISDGANLNNIHISIEEEYTKVCESLENVLLNIREYETLLKSTLSDESELQMVEEEMSELEIKKSQLEDINISLKTALDVLSEASEELQKDFVPVLNYRMADIVKRITAGKYDDLRADSTLLLKVITPETGDVVSVSTLSGGTIDQMYLALRLSVSEMVAQAGEGIPFIMDEIFAQYDDIRTKETFEYLKELALEKQIIFFTCKGREVEQARQVFGNELNIVNL